MHDLSRRLSFVVSLCFSMVALRLGLIRYAGVPIMVFTLDGQFQRSTLDLR
jgi:hypothetical protein